MVCNNYLVYGNALNVSYKIIEKFKEKMLITNKRKKINSIQIYNYFYNEGSIIYGVFDISELDYKDNKINNSDYDKFYEYFVDIRSIIENNVINFEQLKNICIKIIMNLILINQ